jgi:hypothetical protein
MRAYSVAVAAVAIGAPTKWLDNLLSQHVIPELAPFGRGVSRRLSRAAVTRLAIIRELHQSLGCGVREAVSLAARVLASGDGRVQVGGHVGLMVDRDALELTLDRRLQVALESAPAPRRGRPPRRRAPVQG